MQILITEGKNVNYVELIGELISETVLEFKDKVYPLLYTDKKVLAIDLGKVENIDSTGIGSLVSAKKTAKMENKEIIIYDFSPKIEKFFFDVGLQNFFSTMEKKEIEEKYNS
jgi:anti-sigma B factor antagonist